MRSPGRRVALLAFAALAFERSATAEETFRISVPQRGLWDTAVSEMSRRSGIMQKYGLDLEILYTSGGAESYQAVISGSIELKQR
jgi:NitT/TauT family transport system substrate-binding protein